MLRGSALSHSLPKTYMHTHQKMKEDQQLSSSPFPPHSCLHLLKHLDLEIFPRAENQNLLVLACKSDADSHLFSGLLMKILGVLGTFELADFPR